MTSKLIVGFGEALVDVLPSGEVIGGAPLNFAVRSAEISRILGWKTSLITRIGADERGERILERLNSSPIDTTAIQVDSTMQTGYVDVTLQDGQPDYTIGEQVAWDEIRFDENAAELAATADTICFGTLAQRSETSRQTLLRILDSAPATTAKILDINIRKPFPSVEVIDSSLKAADILKCNEDELLQLAEWLKLNERESAVEIAAELQQQYELRGIFWTRGSLGCCWQDGKTQIDGPVPKLDRASDADSVGAGDAASAALAIGITGNWSPKQIVRAANLCGAFAASRRGPTEPLTDDLLEQITAPE